MASPADCPIVSQHAADPGPGIRRLHCHGTEELSDLQVSMVRLTCHTQPTPELNSNPKSAPPRAMSRSSMYICTHSFENVPVATAAESALVLG